MANHVSGYLSVRQISEEGQKVWDKTISKLEKSKSEGDYEVHLGHLLFEDFEKDWDFHTMCDEIGAKWAYATDYDESMISMYSAWSPCLSFVENLAIEIGKVDPDVQLVLTYEDEFPNFVGVATYNYEGTVCDNELDIDELLQICRNNDPDLEKLWDEENEDWMEDKEEEAYEILSEIQWDVINEWQNNNEEW